MSNVSMPWFVLVVVVLALSVQGCASQAGGDAAGASAASIYGQWTLVSIDGDDVDTLIQPSAKRPNLQINEDGRISGHAGVNRMNGSVDADKLADGMFSAGPLASTMMAGPEDLMTLEHRVLEALGRVNRFRIDGDQLYLLDGDQTVLVYEAMR